MRFRYLSLGLALLLLAPVAFTQSLVQTPGPPGAQFFGAAEWDGRLFAAGRYGGLFTRDVDGWTTEPLGLRLGTFHEAGGHLFAYNGSQLHRNDGPAGWTSVWDDFLTHLWAGADSLLVLASDTFYVSADGSDWRNALRGRTVVDEEGNPVGEELFSIFEAVQAPDGAFWIAAFASSTTGIYRSEDGADWVHLPGGLPPFAFPRTLFATAAGEVFMSNSSLVYGYDEATETWVEQEGLPQMTVMRFVEASGTVFLHGYASTSVIYRRDGTTWTAVTKPEDNVVAIAPSPDGLFAVGQNGLYEGAGNGTWTPLHDGVVASQAQPHRIGTGVALRDAEGWLRSDDGGDSWQPVDYPAVGAIYDFGDVVIGTAPDDVYRSTDGGETWQLANTGINVGPFHKRNFRDVERHDGTIYGGLYSSRAIKHQGGETVGGVYRSTDDGQSWALLGNNFPTNSNGFRAGVTQLAATATHLIASTQEGLVRIAHGGSSWEALPSPSVAPAVSLEAAGGRVVLMTYNELFTSEDDGSTWVPFTDGLPDASYRRLLGAGHGEVYLLISPLLDPVTGLYRLGADGWEDTGVVVPDWLTWYRIAVQEDYVYLGTANHGLWRYDPRGIPTADGPDLASNRPLLEAPRPNPASRSAELRLTWPEADRVQVELFDLLGRRVALLHDGDVAAGASLTIRLDAQRLPPGHYLVRATGGEHRAAQRLTVVR